MELLKKGMQFIDKDGVVKTLLEIGKSSTGETVYTYEKDSFGGSYAYYPEGIDWEETAKINGIDLEHEKDKKMYIDTCIENGMTKEQAIKECDLVSKPFNPKYNSDKLDWSLLPISEVEEIVKVLDYGKHKYEKNGWKNVEDAKDRYLSAAYRHLVEHTKGNKIDEESGLSHLSHLAANVIFLMWFENNEEE